MNTQEIDYKSMFIIGMVLFPAGIITGIFPIWAVGFAFAMIALVNRSKWKKT